MSNMYGYSDYHGPNIVPISSASSHSRPDAVATTAPRCTENDDVEDDDDDDNNPLQVGFWMEGDSLAPPCGTSISTIHDILQVLNITPNVVLYDLGCGDGRICIEAFHFYRCIAIGIEVESDLVRRAQTLITNLSTATQQQQQLSSPSTLHNNQQQLPQVHCMDLRQIFQEWTTIIDSNNEHRDSLSNTSISKFPLPTIIFLYLLPEALLEIAPSLSYILRHIDASAATNSSNNNDNSQECRIVCNTWGIPTWNAIQEISIPEKSAPGVSTTIYIYTVQSIPSDESITDM